LKVLILKPSSLGDVIHALPVLRLLKKAYPASQIYWWLESSLVPLLQEDPDLAGVIPFQRQRWANPLFWHEAWGSLREIREHHFDWVIDLQSLLRSGIVAWLANGEFTIGLDDPREGARAFYDITIPRPSYDTHAVDWYQCVLPWLKVPVDSHFDWLPPRKSIAEDIQTKWHPGSSTWVALQPGARWKNKRWPVEHFAELVRQALKQIENIRFVILGSVADAPLGRAIASISPSRCLDLTGATSLAEMVEWIRLCQCMVTNDTGPMHVAAALGKPVISLFGPTEPRRTGPYGQVATVNRLALPCVPCMKSTCSWPEPLECLRGISPSNVLSMLKMQLPASPAFRKPSPSS
jgi:ADP-heptose:LPS heptosyltransferase